MRHPSRPPDVPALIDALLDGGVRFVLAGSVATGLHGGEVSPGDLDIVPDMARDNLARLATVLVALEACVADVESVFTLGRREDGEFAFERRPASAAERAALLAWQPRPDDPASFDQLLHTRLGNLDVVPVLSGSYAELSPRAVLIACAGRAVPVAHVDDLLATLTVPRRAKDVERVRFLRTLQRRDVRHPDPPM